MSLKIIPFNPLYINRFRDLNVAWLQKYFYVEPKDTLLLENCKKSIIDQGGHIYLAEYDGQVVGCFSFIRLNETTYELGKMAVDPKYQGLKIGQRLLEFAIEFAHSKKWKKLSYIQIPNWMLPCIFTENTDSRVWHWKRTFLMCEVM